MAIRDGSAPRSPRDTSRCRVADDRLSGVDIDRIYRPDVVVRTVYIAPAGTRGVAVWNDRGQAVHSVVVPSRRRDRRDVSVDPGVPGRKLVTAIEVLSPTNKKTTDAREEYLDKREISSRSSVNLVRSTSRGPADATEEPPPPNDYRS